MIWGALIVVSVLLLALFFGVIVAGGRAHDRQNLDAARKQARDQAKDDGPAPPPATGGP